MAALDSVQKFLAPLALGVFALHPPEAAATLSGRYRIVEAESENGREKLRKAMEGRRPGGPTPRERPAGGGRRGAPDGAGGPGGPGARGHGPASESLGALVEAPRAMTVTHTPTEIAVLEQDGRLRTLHPDGKPYKAEGGAVEVKTRWEGSRLRVESKGGRGAAVVEAWSLEPASGKLTIETTLEWPGGSPVTFRSVYERLDEAS